MLSRVIELLARHPDAQAELRRELTEATAGAGRSLADIDYEVYVNLPYLEAIIRETVRL